MVPVVIEEGLGMEVSFGAVSDEVKVVRDQLQLSVRLGAIRRDKDDELGMAPARGLVAAEFHAELVAFLGGPSDGALDVRGCPPFQNRVFLDPSDEGDAVVGQCIHDRARGKGGIEADIKASGMRGGGPVGVPDETKRTFGAGGVALAQQGMDETVTQAGGVVVSLGAEGGHEGIVFALPVVPVVGGTFLVAEDLKGNAVDIEGAPSHGVSAAGGEQVVLDGMGEVRSEGFEVVFVVGDPIDEAGAGGLAGRALAEYRLPGPVPNRSFEGRVMRHAVEIVRRGIAEGQGVEALAKELEMAIGGCYCTSTIPSTV